MKVATVGMILTVALVSLRGQETPQVIVSLRLSPASVSGGLPIRFEAQIQNLTGSSLAIWPFDEFRPGSILKLDIDGSHFRPRSGRATDVSVEDVIIPGAQRTVLVGYLEDYLERMQPGVHEVSYRLSWRFRSSVGARDARVESQGKLRVEVLALDQNKTATYLSERLAIVKLAGDQDASRRALRELTLVQGEGILDVARELHKLGYSPEALMIARRVMGGEANSILADMLTPDQNPVSSQEIIHLLKQRNVSINSRAIARLLTANNTATQLLALELVDVENAEELRSALQSLTTSSNTSVRELAGRVQARMKVTQKP